MAKVPKPVLVEKLLTPLETHPKGGYDPDCRHPPFLEGTMLYWKIRAASIVATLASFAAFAGLGKVW
jgi:hypothetical protein